jgi:hypothetical protein
VSQAALDPGALCDSRGAGGPSALGLTWRLVNAALAGGWLAGVWGARGLGASGARGAGAEVSALTPPLRAGSVLWPPEGGPQRTDPCRRRGVCAVASGLAADAVQNLPSATISGSPARAWSPHADRLVERRPWRSIPRHDPRAPARLATTCTALSVRAHHLQPAAVPKPRAKPGRVALPPRADGGGDRDRDPHPSPSRLDGPG